MIRLQQPVVNFVAVDDAAAQSFHLMQQRRFAAAGAAGDTQHLHSWSSVTIWNPAAFRSRFWTA